ncbi:MAG: acyltransferase [Saprospiraceae bacterium]|jgi:peptidoglycan/LPS O-acetylase OafA/YrhL|nr:acyltransferase [Saprospiraceae bacterium]
MYIKGFDGLRCYSILLVIVTHLGVAHYFEEGSYIRNHVFYFFSGAAGVNLFFAISGYLITSLILQEIKKTGMFNIRFFFIRRFLRLLPPLMPFFIAIFIFMKLGFIRETMMGIMLSLFYLFNFVPKAKAFWTAELSHTWSLAVEEQFYILWAAIFKFFRDFQRVMIILFLLILCVVATKLLPSIVINITGKNYRLDEVFFVTRWTIPAIGPILIGALSAIVYFSNWKNIQQTSKGFLFGFLSFVVFFSPFYLPGFLMPYINLFHGLGSAMLLLWITSNQNSIVITFLEWKPIKYIGVISYSVYIWQGFFVRTGQDMLPKIWVHEAPQNVVFSFIMAIISFELLEKRFLKFKKNFK